MANTNLTISTVTKEALRILKNELGFTKGINKQYDDRFAIGGAKIGDTISIRKPNRFSVSSGATLVNQDVVEESVPLQLDSQKHVAFKFSSKEMALDIDEFSARYIKPAITALANQVDVDGLALYKDVAQAVGAPGTTPATFQVALDAAQKLYEAGCPVDDLASLVINPAAQGSMVNALKGLFQSSDQIKKQYEKGMMGMAAGFKWKMDQNIAVHTTGTHSGTPLVNGASQSGAALITDGWATGAVALKEGDVFTIAGVYAVNPQSKASTGALKQFTITADISDTAGAITMAISPSMVLTGAKKNVLTGPADNAAIVILGATGVVTPVNMAYHKDAFVLGCADLYLPGGVDMAARATDSESGLSLRIVRDYDISTDNNPCRIDILYGLKTIRPELACRLMG